MASASEYGTTRPAALTFQAPLRSPVQWIGFWTAVVLPFLLIGLVAAGVATQYPLAVVGLAATNVAAIVAGKDYKQ
jgi:hypothetical protein